MSITIEAQNCIIGCAGVLAIVNTERKRALDKNRYTWPLLDQNQSHFHKIVLYKLCTWYTLVPQTSAATWRCFVFRFARYSLCFQVLLCLLYLVRINGMYVVVLFLQLVRFKSLPHLLRGDTTNISSIFPFDLFL